MNSHLDKIIEQQIQLGLILPEFKKKYIFVDQSTSDAFYYDRFSPSPSQLIGFSSSEQQKIKNIACLMIIQAGIFLKLPITTTISAQIIFHYFYQRVSFITYDFRDVSMGSVFLAAQCQQTIRRSAHIALVFDQIFKIHQKSRRPTRIADIESKQFKAIQSKVIQMSKLILIELGFEVYRILETPHRYMNSIFQMFSKHNQIEKIAQMSWGYLNDSYRSGLCLYYPPQIIAVSCIFLSLRKLDLGVGSVPWWCLLQASLQIMQKICVDILSIYENRADYYGVESILKKIAKDTKLENVFPVPYYRKIINDQRIEVTKKLQVRVKERGLRQSRERSRQKCHEEGKKNKKQKSPCPQTQFVNEVRKIEQIDSIKKSTQISYIEDKDQSKMNKSLSVYSINSKLKEMLDQKVELKGLKQEEIQKGIDIELNIDASLLSQLRSKFLNAQNKQKQPQKGQKDKLL